ncbi:MAG TPA: DEAD/DEAH box helicase [Methylothermaceae bacterium]|nr:DEAD/DEAH box helicase [Methylothermaceae bacterium]
MNTFYPAVAQWFRETFGQPTDCQKLAWQALKENHHTLVAAPTGSGKTLAAFLSAIDHLVKQAAEGTLATGVQAVYVSPLKALSHDIERNLAEPLEAIQKKLFEEGISHPPIRAQCRTGDTPQAVRTAMAKHPPHILVTTPESLYILLTSESGRRMLETTRTVIVDELHALIGNKRGAHLALSLERLQHLCQHPLTRIGLSATQTPLATTARFLLGSDIPLDQCEIIDSGHLRPLDLDIVLPDLPLEAVLSQEAAKSLYDRMSGMIRQHRTTLVFVNTRRQAERVARALSERLGEEHVTSHHGSLSRPQRLDAEKRLKAGELKALVATASLELGIDIGDVDLVCQLGTTDSIATFLQRVGRAGHSLEKTPKGRLFPTSRDELIVALALIDAIQRRELETYQIIARPLDVLAQQIVAMAACEDWHEDNLFHCIRKAAPYRDLPRDTFDDVIQMLATGYTTRRGRRGAYLHYDAIHRQIKGRKGARLTAITCGGAIPDNADYRVILEPSGECIGSVDEDFAVESLAGDIFQLGNNSWRVLRLEQDSLRVEDAQGQPPSIPFWFGEAPGRSDVLASAVSRLRQAIFDSTQKTGIQSTQNNLVQQLNINPQAIRQAVEYLAAAGKALGVMPSQENIVMERFFDEAGDLHLIIHSPFGSRINRAWGLALRKRFCRGFNFELQAAATEDALLLSLGAGQSFPLESVKDFLKSATVRHLLIQALLDNPMFTVRWRWNATISLAVRRFQNGRKTPPYLVRMQAEDLVTAVFPEQMACLENIQGDRTIPDHPLIQQTLDDCLHEAMDIEGLERILKNIETDKIKVTPKETVEPSPLGAEMLSARVYAFIDGAPLEERRVRAVSQRRWLDPDDAEDLGKLAPEAITQVQQEAKPAPTSPEELHDTLLVSGYLLENQPEAHWQGWLDNLCEQGRTARLPLPNHTLWIAAEHWPLFHVLFPGRTPSPLPQLPPELATKETTPEQALTEILRARLACTGPIQTNILAEELGLSNTVIEQALLQLEQDGVILRGDFGWCERALLARIHRLTLNALREAIQPVSGAQFMRFLLRWQHVHPESRLQGQQALMEVISQLEGFEATPETWEREILPMRMADFQPEWLDRLCLSGKYAWLRLSPSGKRTPMKTLPIAFVARRHVKLWRNPDSLNPPESPQAQKVLETLEKEGALFFDELQDLCRLLPSQLENALSELIALGWISADSLEGLQALQLPEAKKRRYKRQLNTLENSGRWHRLSSASGEEETQTEYQARKLLKRYGIVCRALAAKEPAMPSWLSLVRVYRRLEARGEIRGGRFIAGQFGEQFALPEAVSMLRKAHKPDQDPPVVISAADPLNLNSVLSPSHPIPKYAGKIRIENGVLKPVNQLKTSA